MRYHTLIGGLIHMHWCAAMMHSRVRQDMGHGVATWHCQKALDRQHEINGWLYDLAAAALLARS